MLKTEVLPKTIVFGQTNKLSTHSFYTLRMRSKFQHAVHTLELGLGL